MNVGEVVLYSEGGKDFNALVLGERQISETIPDEHGNKYAASHAGKNGEALVTLCFAKERLDHAGAPLPSGHGTGQTTELVQYRLDVAHESLEYTADQKRYYGKSAYDGGRWRFVPKPAADWGKTSTKKQ